MNLSHHRLAAAPTLLAGVAGALVPSSLALVLLTASGAQAQGTAEPYGCGLNPPGSLTLLAGSPAPGAALTFGVDDPTGSKPPGSLAMLILALNPSPAYPCGVPLPGLGLSGSAGELLISLGGPTLTLGPKSWAGQGQPAQFAFSIPPQLAGGSHFYAQGALVDVVGGSGIGLTEALDIHLAVAAQPDLQVRSTRVLPIPVAPGEPLQVRAVIENRGASTAAASVAKVCLGTGNCADLPVPELEAGASAEVVATFATDESWVAANPHWPTVEADSTQAVEESDEENNSGGTGKPGFVVDLVLVAPSPEIEHDEVIELQDGVKLSHELTTYGLDGAKSVNEQTSDPNKPQPNPGEVQEQPRIDPAVAAADESAKPGESIDYLVKFEHGIGMPRLPALLDTGERFSSVNVQTLTLRMGMFEAVRRARIETAKSMVGQLEEAGGEVLEYFALSGSMLVRAPKGYLGQFAENAQVQHVEADQLGESTGDVGDARALLDTDPYFNGGATGAGFIGILDTGVRVTHDLLSSPDHIWFVEDCVDGDSDCNDNGDPAYSGNDTGNHGTSVSAIVTANSNYGTDDRGISASWIDSWRVSRDSDGKIPASAVHRAFDEAVFWGDHIVNCSFGFNQGPSGSIAGDADDAFDAGVVVICSNGNSGGGAGTVKSPALAHKALGVGAYDLDSGADVSYQSDGPTADDRIKPDLQGITNVFTARSTSDSAMSSFGGTSCAAPTVTGAASVLADWFGFTAMSSAAAGKVYATLLGSGTREFTGGATFNNRKGVGKFALPLGGTLYTGSRNVTRFDNDYVTINVPAGASKITAAIWWGENPSNIHRDIDLYLLKPNGTTSDYSIDAESVFERLDVSAPITAGNRDVRIYGYSVPMFQTVTVYYAIHVQ